MKIRKCKTKFKSLHIKFSVASEKIFIFFSIIIFRILIDWYYLDYVSPNWGYMDMGTSINSEKILVSYIIVAILALLIDWNSERFSGIAIQVLFLIMMVPLTSTYSLNNQSTSFMTCCAFSFAMSALLVRQFYENSLYKKSFRIAKKDSRFIFWLMIIGALFYIIMIILPREFNIGVLNILDSDLIYGIRNGGLNLSGIWAYSYIWIYKVVIPVLLGYFLYKRNYQSACAAILIQILIYLSDPHKEMLLGIFLILCLFFGGKWVSYGKLLLGTFICVISGGMFFYKLFDSKIAFYGLDILSRVFHIPASIKFQHFRFFSEMSKLSFSEGRIGRLLGVTYPYGSMSVGEAIAYYVLGVNNNNNAGYIAYAYDDLGYLGILLAGVALAVIFRVFDLYVAEKNQKWITAVAIYPIICLNDVPLLQWLLSGGGIIFLILLWVIDCRDNEQDMLHCSTGKQRNRIRAEEKV